MNLKSFGIWTLLLLIFFLMLSTLGTGITILVSAIIFLVQAILFSIKTEYYDRFLMIMNPGLYSAYSEKSSDFIKKKRKMNIISYFILSAITGLNAFTQMRLTPKIDIRSFFSLRYLLPFLLVVSCVTFLINYVSILITKKSITANEDLAWNIILGFAFTIVILIGFVIFCFCV